jgi:hypothetical protein
MRIGDDKDVALILGISHERLKARICAGALVPPFMQTPGSKYRRWDLDVVEAWLRQYTVRGADLTVRSDSLELSPGPGQVRRGRGRPRKTKK